MIQNTPGIPDWLVTDEFRTKAKLKYEIRLLESKLIKYLEAHEKMLQFGLEIKELCSQLANQYENYLVLINKQNITVDFNCSDLGYPFNRTYLLYSILDFKNRLPYALNLEEEIKIILQMTALYQHMSQETQVKIIGNGDLKAQLLDLFRVKEPNAWIMLVVDFWNKNNTQLVDLSILFRDWDIEQQQWALDFIATPGLVDIVNSIFFYKLYPDKLFGEFIHPEKLVSVRVRLGIIHQFIETLQMQIFHLAHQHGLKPDVDYLFHGDELPQGIMIDVNEEHRVLIQDAVKHLKMVFSPENEIEVTLDRLHDLARAYKFWFNPNRLIDAVMVLEQRLTRFHSLQHPKHACFLDEMVELYMQLTTTQCLDLYGYFANNDSRYLLSTLLAIIKEQSFDWLPPLQSMERNAISTVFDALKCVMEALREALKKRHVNTEAFHFELTKKRIQVGRRNREAVFRIIAIYGREPITISDEVEKLFNDVEAN